MYTRPGKKLLFMGTELAPYNEWNHDTSLDWHLADDPMRAGFASFMEELGRMYRQYPAFWKRDHEWEGFSWIDVADRANSVVSYVRHDGDKHVVVALNFTPVPREHYRIGAPEPGAYVRLLSSDERRFGGSDYPAAERVEAEPSPFHGYAHSMKLTLPPLGAIIMAPERS
jgi:1,4-alpha-glucan branching enzyme